MANRQGNLKITIFSKKIIIAPKESQILKVFTGKTSIHKLILIQLITPQFPNILDRFHASP